MHGIHVLHVVIVSLHTLCTYVHLRIPFDDTAKKKQKSSFQSSFSWGENDLKVMTTAKWTVSMVTEQHTSVRGDGEWWGRERETAQFLIKSKTLTLMTNKTSSHTVRYFQFFWGFLRTQIIYFCWCVSVINWIIRCKGRSTKITHFGSPIQDKYFSRRF